MQTVYIMFRFQLVLKYTCKPVKHQGEELGGGRREKEEEERREKEGRERRGEERKGRRKRGPLEMCAHTIL